MTFSEWRKSVEVIAISNRVFVGKAHEEDLMRAAWDAAINEVFRKIEAQTWLKREHREQLKKALLEIEARV